MARKALAKAAKKTEKTKPRAVRKPLVKITTSGDVTQDLERIFQDGVLVDLNIGYWTATRRNTFEDLGLKPGGVPDFVVGLGTKRLIPKEMADSWQKIASASRYIIERRSFVFPVGQARFVPIDALPQIEEDLNAKKAEFEKASAALLDGDNYTKVRDAMLKEFPEHAAALSRLYPTVEVVRSTFYFVWSVFNVSLPHRAQLKAFDKKKRAESEKVLAQYRQKLEQRMAEFIADVVGTMRTKTVELCLRISEKIKSGDVITNQSLNSIRGFIGRFREMNFVGDERIESLLARLEKNVLGDRDADAFKDNDVLQKELAKSLDGIRKAAEAVTDVSEITGGYGRRIKM